MIVKWFVWKIRGGFADQGGSLPKAPRPFANIHNMNFICQYLAVHNVKILAQIKQITLLHSVDHYNAFLD